MLRSPEAADETDARAPWWRRRWPLHPLLFAAYPVLFLFAANVREQLSLDPIFGPLLATLAGTLAVLIVLRLVYRDWLRAGLATSVVVALFFSYGHVRTASGAIVEGGIRQRYLLAAWALILIVGLVIAWRLRPRAVRTVTTALNVVAAALVVINTVPIIGFQINGFAAPASAQGAPVASIDESSISRRPDIYYLIFDRYSSLDSLREVYEFDNTAFLDELERRGFYVARESNANYLKTALSLTSSLSMDYLDMETLRDEADARDDLKPVYRRLQSGQAVQNHLKSLGYTYIHFGTRYQLAATNSAADRVVRYSAESEFAAVLMETTLLSAVSAIFPEQEIDPFLNAWRYTNFQFEQLERVGGQPGPKFVFVHFNLPHPPFVFDAECNFVPEPEQRERGRLPGFVGQVECANDRILELLDTLQSGPVESHPVILIQADEGQYPAELTQASEQGRWDEATPDELREKYGILNAYYLPSVDPEAAGLYQSITPVNSFRVVFNAYFGTDLELLPDRSWAPHFADYNYDIFEITDIVEGEFGEPAL